MKKILLVMPLAIFSCNANAADPVTMYLENSRGANDISQREMIERMIIRPGERSQQTFNMNGFKPRVKFQSLVKAKAGLFGRCGSFDPNLSIANSLGGGGRMNQMFDNVIDNAIASVQGLAGALIKNSDPGLYEFLENGINIGFEDYLSSMGSCEKMQDVLVNNAPDALMRQTSMAETINKYSQSGKVDIVSLFRSGSATEGEEGVVGVDGQQYGGSGGQSPFRVVSQSALAGWCGLTESSLSLCSTITNSSASRSRTSNTQAENVKKLFPDAESIQNFAAEVVGEVELRSCNGCDAINAIPSQSISQIVSHEAEIIASYMIDILSIDTDQISENQLQSISAESYQISRSNIQSLQQEDDSVKAVFLERLAFDVATAKVLDKVISLRQILITGRANAKLLGNAAVRAEIDAKLVELDLQLARFEQEVRLRNAFDSQTRILLDSRKNMPRSDRSLRNIEIDVRRGN